MRLSTSIKLACRQHELGERRLKRSLTVSKTFQLVEKVGVGVVGSVGEDQNT
jgi:hypothetical protein